MNAAINKPGSYVPIDGLSIGIVKEDGSITSVLGCAGAAMPFERCTALRDKLLVVMNANADALK